MSLTDETLAADTLAARTSPRRSHRERPIRAGDRVGRYVMVDRLGAGGMGVVYAAYDRELDRKIALKLLHPAYGDSEMGQRRLLREAQAMARLRHPNVVTVHDVGTHEGGVFVAMEFVAGRTLRAWLDETGGRRPWSAVVDVLGQAAAGLAAAHDAGLVHRDFKPDNVMLDDQGRARVMDFGLARTAAPATVGDSPLLEGEVLEPGPEAEAAAADRARFRIRERLEALGKLDPSTASHSDQAATTGREPDDAPGLANTERVDALTEAGALVGTPAYMAPEQLGGGEVDARTDQFAFCVVLFEALHGARPFTGETFAELSTNITEGRLSASATEVRVPSWLRRVIMQGLSSDPRSRHADMHAIAQALVAGPRRRRRAVLGTLGVGLLAGLVGFGVYADTSVCAGAEAAVADVWNAQRRGAVERSLSSASVPFAAQTAATVIEGLDAYAGSWIALHESACLATNVHRQQSEEMLDRQMTCLAARKRALDATTAVLEEADDATVEHAVEAVQHLPAIAVCSDLSALRSSAVEPPPPLLEPIVEEARVRVARADALREAGHYQVALDALPIDDHEALAYAPLRAEVELVRGKLLDAAGRRPEAELALRQAVLSARQSGHEEIAVQAEIELTFITGYRLRRADEGRLWADLAGAGLMPLGDPDAWRGRLENHLGVVVHAAGDSELAVAHLRRGRELRARALGDRHLDVAESDYNLGIAFRSRGEYARAREHHERALAARTSLLGGEHPRVAESLSALAVVTLRAGDPRGAIETWERVLAIQEAVHGADHPEVATTLNDLGSALATLGDLEVAQTRFRAALEIWETTLGPRHPSVFRARHNLANVLAEHGETTEARALLQRVLSEREEVLGGEHRDTALTRAELGRVLGDLGENERAEALLHEALADMEAQDVEPIARARAKLSLARVMAQRNRGGEAIDLARSARDIFANAGASYAESLREAEAFLAEHQGTELSGDRSDRSP